MTVQQLATAGGNSVDTSEGHDFFSAKHWLSYFQENKRSRIHINFPSDLSLAPSLRQPLIRSLQRFQIGETGEGKHLKKYARTLNDKTYEECIELFIREEQFHARVLAEMVGAMDGTILSWHWTDLAFIVLRRMMGLKTELFIILIAEIIGKCFYKACADNLKHQLMSDAFSLIVLDEIGHLEFNSAFLQNQMRPFPQYVRTAVHYAWCAIFFTACFVFIADHATTLRALGVTPRRFLHDCSVTFHRCAVRALLLPAKHSELPARG